jgi:hypothetical protein
MIPLLGLMALLQQVPSSAFQGATTPPGGDTLGYWQQHVAYTVVATLDEAQTKLHARATLVYVNNSPDTLHEMFVHQYLNAFRPGSKWSAADAHENQVRFQNLRDPDYGYERFTAVPTVNGTPVMVDYPGAPDSTVAHFRLPAPLAPHDSVRVEFEWDARPSTVPRRQARRGRTWDFAQWYPKVAVYDRGGWEPNPFVPAGELYGEYGTYDVTMVVKDDQVLASTGVPVSGDPGWARVSQNGPPYLGSNAYGTVPPAPPVTVPPGYRAVRFFAENVHHFAWSASPDYKYEGGLYIRPAHTHFQTWDTVGVHVLFKPGDDTTWGRGIAVQRSITALQWLESIWGPYAWPQFTNIHRIEGGGTEFPMMVMNGSDSQGLILHEGGHQFTYGILGNNEWRSGWMDEGLTDYQTYWAQNLTPQEQIGKPVIPPRLAPGYRVNAVTMTPAENNDLFDWQLDILGRAQPIGTPAYRFSEFGIYNYMIYDRARRMYGQLRAAIGDTAFRAFFHDYYDRWALKHVDERAMEASAERASGQDLSWFFREWVHGTGIMDYALGPAVVHTDGTRYETIVRVDRRGDLDQLMPVGVQTSAGWTVVRTTDPLAAQQEVHIVTAGQPLRIQLDPYHITWDWDRRNDANTGTLLGIRNPRFTFNWPDLDQTDRSHTIVALAPALWYSDPQGGVIGARAKTNYLSAVDVYDAGIAFATRDASGPNGTHSGFATRPQLWLRASNPYLPGQTRPLMGYSGDVNYLDGLLKIDVARRWNLSPFVFAPGPSLDVRAYATVAAPSDSLLLPEQWSDATVAEVGGSGAYRSVITSDGEYEDAHASLAAGYATNNSSTAGQSLGAYLRAEGSVGAVRSLVGTTSQLHVRLYGGVANGAPRQRAIYASSQDPFQTFDNDLFRPRGALFKQSGINYLPLGGAGLRGFGYDVPLTSVAAANAEAVQRLGSTKGAWGQATFSASVFGDAGVASALQGVLPGSFLSDAGAGLIARGNIYDRRYAVRLDAPVFVNHASLAGGRGLGVNGSFAPRWVISVGELW